VLHDSDLLAIQEVRSKVEKAYAASQKYRTYTQKQVDAIVESMAAAGRAKARDLAEAAVAETGYGNATDKLAKNLLCADLLPRTIRGMKTVGVLREIPEQKITEIGVPVGVVAAILPTTNPTSTAIYKSIIALKAGNAIVLSPHPRAKNCTCQTADLMQQAAVAAGAPADIIQCITNSSLEATNALMRHPRTSVILSTGGHGIVKAAYSSGKPALGVGPGNVPVLLDASADVAKAVAQVVEGKAFDYGTVCSSEQSVVAVRELRERVLAELKTRQAFLCNDAQKQALEKLLLGPNFSINPNCVGQAPEKIAHMAGFVIPAGTSILVVEIEGVGKQHPLSAEKLSPVLSVCFVQDFAAALDACEAILRFGGLGHTCVIHATDEARVREFGLRMPAFRVLVNTPAPQGSTGITTGVLPSMTLGCGAMAGNITSDNIGPLHLINIKRIAWAVRSAQDAFPAAAQPTAAPAPHAPARVDRPTVVAAVEKYLSQRGVATQGSVTADVVDRFLTSRRSTPVQPVACAAPQPSPAPPAPQIAIVDFVSEHDVRVALQQARKIYIGPKTIITPSARDLASQHDTLVLAKRS
jgi:acetaldehyde dehydrogenase (acetylating)